MANRRLKLKRGDQDLTEDEANLEMNPNMDAAA